MWTQDQLSGLMPVHVAQSEDYAAEIYKGTHIGHKYSVIIHDRCVKRGYAYNYVEIPTHHFQTFGEAMSFSGKAVQRAWSFESRVRAAEKLGSPKSARQYMREF